MLSKQTGSEIRIDKVLINFTDEVSLKGIYVEDQAGDTLLYSGRLSVDIDLWRLRHREIRIDNLELDESTIHLKQAADKRFNFQFIIDSLSNPPQPKKEKGKPFTIGLDRAEVKDLYATADLLRGENALELPKLEVRVRDIDLANKRFNINSIKIEDLKGRSVWAERDTTIQRKKRSPNLNYPLSNLGLSLFCDQLDIIDTDILYRQGEPSEKRVFDPQNIHGRDMRISLRNIRLDSTEASTDIRQIHLAVNDQVVLEDFSTRAIFAADRSAVEDLELRFNQSTVSLEAETGYSAFRELLQLDDQLEVDVDLSQLQVNPADVTYFLPVLNDISALKPFLKQHMEANVKVSGTLAALHLKDSRISSGAHKVELSGKFKNPVDPKKMEVNQGIFDVRSTTKVIQAATGESLPAEIGERFNNLHVSGQVDGRMNDMKLKRLRLVTDGLLQASLSGSVRNLVDFENLDFDLNILNLQTGYEDIAAVTDSLPEMLSVLDTVRFAGSVSGGSRDFDLDGALNTPVGKLTSDIGIAFTPDYKDAQYVGDIQIDRFNLGRLLDQDSIGRVSFKASVDGKGLSLDSIDSRLVFDLLEAEYNGYTYRDLHLDGVVLGRQFSGEANMDDQFAQFDFQGSINLNDSIPDFNFNMDIANLDLGALHLMKDSLRIKGKVEADLFGLDPDLMDGFVAISELDLELKDRTWSADTIVLNAAKDMLGIRELYLQTPVADASIYGNFSFSRMVPMVMNFSRDYFDIRNVFTDSLKLYNTNITENQFIEVTASVGDVVPLANFFGVGLNALDTAYLYFLLDESRNDLELTTIVPEFAMDDFSADSIVISGYNTDRKLNLSLNTARLAISDGIFLPGLSIDMTAEDQEADLAVILKNEVDTGYHRLQLLTALKVVDDHIDISMTDPFILNRKEWYADQAAPIELYADRIHVPELILQSDMEALRLLGSEETIGIDLVNFDVANFLELIDIGTLSVNGIMDGRLDIGLTKDQPLIVGELDIWAITVDDNLVGDLTLWAGARGDNAWGTVYFTGFENDLSLEASYDLLTRELDGEVIMEALHVAPFEPFFSEFAQDATGEISGNIRLQGTVDKPSINGKLSFDQVSAFVLPAQTRYTIGSGTIELTSKRITPTIKLLDGDNRTAELSGQVYHDNFSDIKFDLRLFSKEFTFLDSKASDDDLYYGKFVGMVDAAIGGNLDLPRIRASIATKDETDITVQLLSKKAIMNQESYILFYDGKQNYSQSQLDSLAIVRYNVNTGIDLTLNAEITENSTFRLVIDPITGDNLEIRGNADMLVRIPDKGDLSITGTYTVEEGNYRFSYQSLLRRNFGIVKGSRIIFTGDPMNAILDLQAAYSTKASAYTLVADNSGTLSDSDIRSLRRKSDVDVLLDISGKLSSPELSFDLNVAAAEEGAVGGSVSRALANIKQNESELNKQVFSLLLFNSFTGISATGSASTAGTGTAMRSVGSLINSQLNKLAQNADGLEIDFDLDQYAGALSESKAGITEIDFGIRQSLLNDKLVIAVGSNIGLEGGNSSGKALSNVAGDFVLEYKITQGGKYRVKVFQKTDYDALNEDNVWKTGIGFSYQTTFGRQFFKSKRRSEKED